MNAMSSLLQFIGFAMGVLSIVIWVIGVMPGLEWLHIANIPFSAVGFGVSVRGAANARRFRFFGMAGMVFCLWSFMFSIARYRACTRVT